MTANDKPLHTGPIRRMFATLADHSPRGRAFDTVAAMIDMGLIPPEVLTDVVLGAVPIARVMADLAEVMADAAAADEDDPEAHEAARMIVADCTAAAEVLEVPRNIQRAEGLAPS